VGPILLLWNQLFSYGQYVYPESVTMETVNSREPKSSSLSLEGESELSQGFFIS
jgi:hypothetical protein